MLFLILIALAVPGTHNQSPAKAPFDEYAIVTPRRIEWTRGKGEDRHTTVMIRPVVTGLRSPVLKRIRKELEVKKILGFYYRFYKHRQMFGLDYRVTHNRNHILAITFSWNAYFAEHEKGVVFDLRDGGLIKVQDLFLENTVPELVKLINQKLQAELEEMLRNSDEKDQLRYAWKEAENNPLIFTAEDLDEFQINEKGIIFFYHAGFSHQRKWAEPEGHYFFTYSELKNFLKPGTVVSQFVE